MPEKLRPTYKFNETQLEQLKQIIPEAFKDGMLDFNSLYDALKDYNEEDSIEMDDNFYGLYWPGKRQAKRKAFEPPVGTLVPVKGDGIDEENTKNIYIEGDNLEVLKLLQKSYAGKIKMIYIDPPYNTGNDFIYNDDQKETTEVFEKATGQTDEDGTRLIAYSGSINSRNDGRFHSKWLNMMYPRLKLAKSLLNEEGVIFISIDDNEVAQLRKICDEIFGEENFVGQIVWKNKFGSGAMPTGFIGVHEYILAYSKSLLTNITRTLTNEERENYNKTKDEKFKERGGYVTQPLAVTTFGDRPNLRYPVTYNGVEIWPNKQWVWEKNRMQRAIENNDVVFNLQKDGSYNLRSKKYLIDEDGNERKGKPTTFFTDVYTQNGTQSIRELFEKLVFDYSKPVELIRYFLSLEVNDRNGDNDIILDFFSGSSTTAHAVMQLNSEDGGSRQYIMVQLDEPVTEKSNKEAYDFLTKEKKPLNICEIGKERIRRAGKKIQESANDTNKKQMQKDLISDNSSNSLTHILDTGFKVFRLSQSNYKKWQNYTGTDIKAAEDLFAQYENPLIDNWKEEYLLTEIMLTEGFPLDSTVAVIKDFKKNKVTQISSDFCEHSLFVCLDKKVHTDTINALTLSQHDIFICLDNAVTDQDKARLDDKGLIKTI